MDYGAASYTAMREVCIRITGSDLGFWSYATTNLFRWTINVLNNFFNIQITRSLVAMNIYVAYMLQNIFIYFTNNT